MAIQVDTVTIGTSATKLTVASGGRGFTITFTTDASTVIEVGGSGVTFGNGYALQTDTEYTFSSEEGDLYAVVTSGTLDVDVLSTGTSEE